MTDTQTLDPLTWPMPTFYMDTGAVVSYYVQPEGHSLWPCESHICNDITGATAINFTDKNLIPLSSNDAVLACGIRGAKMAVTWSYTGAYPSYVYKQDGSYKEAARLSLESATPPYRYSGNLRLAAQAHYGRDGSVNGLCYYSTADPDTDGVIYSPDGRFYYVRMSGTGFSVQKLLYSGDQCLITKWSSLADGDDKTRLLAYIMSSLKKSQETPTTSAITGMEAFYSGRAGVGYGWHWCYDNTNQCARVLYKMATDGWDATTPMYQMTLGVVSFSIPSAANEATGSPITASLTLQQTDANFMPSSSDDFWIPSDSSASTLSRFGVPPDYAASLKVVPTGAGVTVDCFYNEGGLQELKYTTTGTQTVNAVNNGYPLICGGDTPAADYVVSKTEHEIFNATWSLAGQSITHTDDLGSYTIESETYTITPGAVERIPNYYSGGAVCSCDGVGKGSTNEKFWYDMSTATALRENYQGTESVMPHGRAVVPSKENPDAKYLMQGAYKARSGTMRMFNSATQTDYLGKFYTRIDLVRRFGDFETVYSLPIAAANGSLETGAGCWYGFADYYPYLQPYNESAVVSETAEEFSGVLVTVTSATAISGTKGDWDTYLAADYTATNSANSLVAWESFSGGGVVYSTNQLGSRSISGGWDAALINHVEDNFVKIMYQGWV